MDVGTSVGPMPDAVAAIERDYDHVELSVGEGEVPVDEVDDDRLRASLDARDLDLVVHLPFRQPLATTVERVDRAAHDYLADLLAWAGDVGATKAVAHVAGRRHGLDRRTMTRERVVPAVERVAAAGREHGVEVCFENVGNVGGTPLSLVGDVLDRTDASLCLDVGHAVAEHDTDRTVRFVEDHADALSHLHVHDVRYRGDSHIPIGSGEVDYDAVGTALAEVDFDGTVTVEVFTDDGALLADSAERFVRAAGLDRTF
ncbi:sugar phosphate isomerase/epimerase [Halobacteriales archaeon SW_12_71_31]|nr:MAG: sugar phosphate isomerase/epimerase [Halobacteriales archaeon SW_12_71_31]